jgi:hypothetical protein
VRLGEERVEARVVGPAHLDRTLAGRPRRPPVRLAAERMTAGRLDEHDLGAQVGEDPPRDRRGLAREVEDAKSVEQCWHASNPRGFP